MHSGIFTPKPRVTVRLTSSFAAQGDPRLGGGRPHTPDASVWHFDPSCRHRSRPAAQLASSRSAQRTAVLPSTIQSTSNRGRRAAEGPRAVTGSEP
jgi:hypothetical protein